MERMVAKKTPLSVATKTGDQGQSGLITGKRLPKDHPVFAAVGSLDELNSWLGLIVVQLHTEFETYGKHLQTIQETLFYVGAECAGSEKVQLKDSHLQQLEKWSETLQHSMAENWHTQFVLPGGTELGAYLDIARSVCRRAERDAVGLSAELELRPVVLKYLNRLSDYLYVLRCKVNQAVAHKEKFFEATD